MLESHQLVPILPVDSYHLQLKSPSPNYDMDLWRDRKPDNGQQLRKPMAQSKSEVIRKRKQGVHCHLSINDERTCLGLHSCSNNICNIWETRGGVITITGKDSN
jgi:hypothetical protein